MGTTVNIQGSLFVFELNTGRVLKSINITVLHIPDCVIKKVDTWGCCAQNGNSTTDLKLLYRTKEKYNWNNDEVNDTYDIDLVEEAPHPSVPSDMPCVHLEADIPGPAIVDFK